MFFYLPLPTHVFRNYKNEYKYSMFDKLNSRPTSIDVLAALYCIRFICLTLGTTKLILSQVGVAFKVFKPYFLPSTRKAELEARAVHSNWDTIGSGRNGELDYWLHHNLFLVLCDSMVNQLIRLFL